MDSSQNEMDLPGGMTGFFALLAIIAMDFPGRTGDRGLSQFVRGLSTNPTQPTARVINETGHQKTEVGPPAESESKCDGIAHDRDRELSPKTGGRHESPSQLKFRPRSHIERTSQQLQTRASQLVVVVLPWTRETCKHFSAGKPRTCGIEGINLTGETLSSGIPGLQFLDQNSWAL